jgi:hypothetical protein
MCIIVVLRLKNSQRAGQCRKRRPIVDSMSLDDYLRGGGWVEAL